MTSGRPSMQKNRVSPGGTSSARAIRCKGNYLSLKSDVISGGRTGRAGCAFAQVLGEPAFMFDLLVQDGKGHVVGAVVLAEAHIADFSVRANGAALRLDPDGEHLLRIEAMA